MIPCLFCGDATKKRKDPRNIYCDKVCFANSLKGIAPMHATTKATEANTGRPLKLAHKLNISRGRYKHGTSPNGYLRFSRIIDPKRRDIHREIVNHLSGMVLPYNLVAHHIDGNKINNNPKNLIIMTRSEHSKLHATQNYGK